MPGGAVVSHGNGVRAGPTSSSDAVKPVLLGTGKPRAENPEKRVRLPPSGCSTVKRTCTGDRRSRREAKRRACENIKSLRGRSVPVVGAAACSLVGQPTGSGCKGLRRGIPESQMKRGAPGMVCSAGMNPAPATTYTETAPRGLKRRAPSLGYAVRCSAVCPRPVEDRGHDG